MGYNIAAIEVIFNMFRLKPTEELFKDSKKNDIGIIARMPLASGLLTGRYSKDTVFLRVTIEIITEMEKPLIRGRL